MKELIEALQLLEYALHLRVHGERAPGGNETWAEFDRRCEAFLRHVRGLPES
jgi:broad specificity phosphatase PhoE